MALQLCRLKHRSLHNPSLAHLFSTSQNDDNNNNNNNPSRLNSYLSDVKSSLKRQQQPRPPILSRPLNKEASFEEIRKNIAEFWQRASVPPLTEQNQSRAPSQQISFQELYKRNANTEGKPGGKFSFDAIRESLRQMKSNNTTNNINNTGNNVGKNADSFSLYAFKNSLRLKPQDGSTVIGGTLELPVSVFGKEMKEDKSGGDRGEMMTEFVKMYSYDELGQKLRKLRPDGFQGEFSLEELNERLMRLREMEEKESESRIVGVTFKDLRESLVRLKKSGDEKAKKSSAQRLDILGQLGGTPDFMLHPPKEHLVEQFLNPDMMSSAEKMKIERAEVREEFKMSESDCGSARVQVAQLTKKIKHLSSVLHKKDKHSLKGLHAMVQKRKRLLKYLRRTDWNSYCLVLSKLGLRDNPDYKAT